MAELKLGKLPDRTPVKLTINVMPELYQQLQTYAAAYATAYGVEEPLTELIPPMLSVFLEGDREFRRSRTHARRRD